MPSTNAPRPWRSLGVLGLLLVMMYGTMALLGEWTPRLGLDLRGGTSITLSATTPDGSDPTPESMRQAVDIVRARVNGSGVAEAEITTQGSTNIVVQVPGVGEDELVRLVGQTAELRFRPVRAVIPGGSPAPAPSETATPTPGATGSATPAPTSPEPTASPAAGRALTEGLLAQPGTPSPTASPTPSPSPSASATAPAAVAQPPAGEGPPSAEEQAQLEALDCADLPEGSLDDPSKSLFTCDEGNANRFLLGPADVVGTDVDSATAGIPQGDVSFVVNLDFTDEGSDKFFESTQKLAGQTFPNNAFAIVLDGKVVSYPTVNEPIPGGQGADLRLVHPSRGAGARHGAELRCAAALVRDQRPVDGDADPG